MCKRKKQNTEKKRKLGLLSKQSAAENCNSCSGHLSRSGHLYPCGLILENLDGMESSPPHLKKEQLKREEGEERKKPKALLINLTR